MIEKTKLQAEKEKLEKQLADKQAAFNHLITLDSEEATKLRDRLKREILQIQGELKAVELFIEGGETWQKAKDSAISSTAFLRKLCEYLGDEAERLVGEVKTKMDEKKK